MPQSGRLAAFKTLALIACLGALVGFCVSLQWWWREHWQDIHVYWEAGTRMRAGGASLYTMAQDPVYNSDPYIYPPFFAALFAPLTWLPRWGGFVAWTVAQLALIGATFEGARRLVAASERRDLALWLFVALIGALWANLVEGQVNLLLAAFLVWGLHWLESGKTWRGALMLAAAMHLKVIPIVLFAVLIVQGRWRAAIATAACCAVLWLVPLVWTIPAHGLAGGLARNVTLSGEFARSIVEPRLKSMDPSALGGVRAPNNSLPAVCNRYFGEGQRLSHYLAGESPLVTTLPRPVVQWMGLGLAAAMGLFALIAARVRRHDPVQRALAAGVALLAGMFGNLLFWPHHMCVSVVLLAPLWAAHQRKWVCWTAAGLVLVLAWLPLAARESWPDWLGVLGVPTLAFVGLWGWAIWTLLRARPAPLRDEREAIYSRPDEQTPAGNPAA